MHSVVHALVCAFGALASDEELKNDIVHFCCVYVCSLQETCGHIKLKLQIVSVP